jgi:hypothetical protein
MEKKRLNLTDVFRMIGVILIILVVVGGIGTGGFFGIRSCNRHFENRNEQRRIEQYYGFHRYRGARHYHSARFDIVVLFEVGDNDYETIYYSHGGNLVSVVITSRFVRVYFRDSNDYITANRYLIERMIRLTTTSREVNS